MSKVELPDLIEFAKRMVPAYLNRADNSNWVQALTCPTSLVRMFFDLGRGYERLCRENEAYRNQYIEIRPGVFDRTP